VKHRLSPAFAILFILVLFVSALANTPPVASFEVRTSADSSQTTLVFDATASHDPDGTIASYQWSFGDGYSGSGVTKTHSFPSVSTYTVTLLVTDNGKASQLMSQTQANLQPRLCQILSFPMTFRLAIDPVSERLPSPC